MTRLISICIFIFISSTTNGGEPSKFNRLHAKSIKTYKCNPVTLFNNLGGGEAGGGGPAKTGDELIAKWSQGCQKVVLKFDPRVVTGIQSQFDYVDMLDANKVKLPGVQWSNRKLVIEVTPESSGQIFFDNGEQVDFDFFKELLKK